MHGLRSMIYLHKILPALFLPVVLVLLILLAVGFSKKPIVAFLGAFVLFFLSIPLTSDYLFRSLEQFQTRKLVDEVSTGDAVVVLSGGLTSAPLADGGWIPEWDDPDRFFAGVELLKANKAPLLIFTGGWIPWLPDLPLEGDILKQYAIQLGVPPDRIIVTPKVDNTEDEAQEVRKYLGGSKRVILVTSAYHMPRAQSLFVAFGVDVIPFPVDFRANTMGSFTVLHVIPGAGSLFKSETVMKELLGRAFYTLKFALLSPQ